MPPVRYLLGLLAVMLALGLAPYCERSAGAASEPAGADPRVRPADDPLVWFVYDLGRPPLAVPQSWASWAPAVIACESGWDQDAVGAQGERGLLQLHPVHFPSMERYGYDPGTEADRLAYGLSLWGWSGETWARHWRYCSRRVGAP